MKLSTYQGTSLFYDSCVESEGLSRDGKEGSGEEVFPTKYKRNNFPVLKVLFTSITCHVFISVYRADDVLVGALSSR